MITKLMNHLCKQHKAKKDAKVPESKKNNEAKGKVIGLEYAENICHNLFEMRQSQALQPRIRFKIQDVIDAYKKDWNFAITDMKNKSRDNDGFQQIYVPKDQILADKKGGKKTEDKDGHEHIGYMYMKKAEQKTDNQSKVQEKPK